MTTSWPILKGWGYGTGPHSVLRRIATHLAVRAHFHDGNAFIAMVDLSDTIRRQADIKSRQRKLAYGREWRRKKRHESQSLRSSAAP